MGEVYRARDTRLDRTVAVKVLASTLATDPQLRERFEREARAISSLNHPNICVLYDVGRERPPGADSPVEYIVMEYLEGETLATRLARGATRSTRGSSARLSSSSAEVQGPAQDLPPTPPMPVDEAVGIAIQIARALDRAHCQGIVHRDLKPGNVMLLKSDGPIPQAKLLDFGLVRLMKGHLGTAGAGSSGSDAALAGGTVNLADLTVPTVSTPLTVKGTILGTLQYMAPEQLEGKDSDARTDIFAFGAMLFEMLTGKRPFMGRSQASLIGAILDDDPPAVASLQPAVPPLIDEIVRRSLAKDPEDRWQSARDVARQLEWAVSQGAPTDQAVTPDLSGRSRTSRRFLQAVALALICTGVGAGVAAWRLWPQPATPPIVTRFALDLPPGQEFGRFGRRVLALSPDGTRLVYVATRQLHLRVMSELTPTPIRGTEGEDPTEPVFSPDGQWVAYWSANQLKKVPVAGGTPQVLSAADNPNGGSWIGERILLGQNTSEHAVIEIPANGGSARALVTLDDAKAERAQSPQVVADGRAVLFALGTRGAVWDEADVVVHELSSGRRTLLVKRASDPQLLPNGYLLYRQQAALFATRFDSGTLTVSGDPVQVIQGVRPAPPAPGTSGAAQAAWSPSGMFAYVPGEALSSDRELQWVDRAGKAVTPRALARAYGISSSDLRVSPDGTRVAVLISDEGTAANRPEGQGRNDIWIWHVARNSFSRVTVSGAVSAPLWTRDSRQICYTSGPEVFCQSADGVGERQSLVKYEGPGRLYSVMFVEADHSRLLLGVEDPKHSMGIVMVTRSGQPATRPLLQTASYETAGVISPDGRWLAYQSNESGQVEVYVRPFPAVDTGRWQVSTGGGSDPRWAADGRELFYAFTDSVMVGGPARRTVMSVAVQSGDGFVAGAPTVALRFPERALPPYDVARDGRFVFNVRTAASESPASRIVVIQNWFEELRGRLR